MSQRRPSFHDGYLTGIQVADREATISLRQWTGDSYELRLEGVQSLQMEDFREGNIISRLEITTGQRPDGSWFLDRLAPGPHPTAAADDHEIHSRNVAALVAGIVAGQSTLVEITSSYGADLVALCNKATLRKMAPKVTDHPVAVTRSGSSGDGK